MIEDERLNEIEETLASRKARLESGESDPYLVIYAALKEEGEFDAENFIQRLAGSLAYDGPERRRAKQEAI